MKKTRKLFSLDELHQFLCAQNASVHFSAGTSGCELPVQVFGVFESQDENMSEGLYYGRVHAFHDLGNLNGSNIPTETLEANIVSMTDRPILADIIDLEDGSGNKDFSGHTMVYDEKTDKVIYIEKAVGHFVHPEDFHIEYSEEYERNFVVADCVVYEEYTDACDILRRRGTVACSVELVIRDMSFNAKTKELVINDFYVQGCTLLGEAVKPGMAGAHASFTDASVSKGEANSNNQLVDTMTKLLNALSEFNINGETQKIPVEGGKNSVKLKELLEKYSKTEADLEFSVEGLNDEELEAKFAEAFEEGEPTAEPVVGEGEGDEPDDEGSENGDPETEPDAGDPAEDPDPDTEPGGDTGEGEFSENKYTRIVNEDGSVSISYQLSHDDIRGALYGLIAQYEEMDNDWYYINSVFDDHFIFEGMFGGHAYGQKYTVDDDLVAFEGERYELFSEWLTASEKAELESMRANYSELKSQLDKYVSADKDAVLADEAYELIRETDEFKALSESKDQYSISELQEKCDAIYGKFCKAKKSFAATPKTNRVAYGNPKNDEEPKSPYGNLFAEFKKNKK